MPVQEKIPRRSSPGPAPLSFAQQRLWLVDRLEPGSPAYNMPYALRLRGRLDAAALRASLDALVRRHETLRTVFEERDGGPVQVVLPPAPVALAELDLRALPDPEREAERLVEGGVAAALRPGARPAAAEHAAAPGRGRPRAAASRFTTWSATAGAAACWCARSPPCTAPSAGARSRGCPELPVQYADYAVWQRGRLGGRGAGSARRLLEAGAARRAAAAGDPHRRSARARGRARAAGSHALRPAAGGCRAGCGRCPQREGATPFMTLLAGWQALLGRWAGQEDVVVGSPIAGRDPARAGGADRLLRQHAGAAHGPVGRSHLARAAGADPRDGAGRRTRTRSFPSRSWWRSWAWSAASRTARLPGRLRPEPRRRGRRAAGAGRAGGWRRSARARPRPSSSWS